MDGSGPRSSRSLNQQLADWAPSPAPWNEPSTRRISNSWLQLTSLPASGLATKGGSVSWTSMVELSMVWKDADMFKIAPVDWRATTWRATKVRPSRKRSTSKRTGSSGSPTRRK